MCCTRIDPLPASADASMPAGGLRRFLGGVADALSGVAMMELP